MSSFVVDDKTINVIVEQIASDRFGAYIHRKLAAIGYNVKTEIGKERLANAMYGLNLNAVESRYDDITGMTAAGGFRYENVFPHTKVAAYKAMRCWLYQCAEGDTPEEPIYKTIEEYSNNLAFDIISSLPEWEKADMWK